ncbi:MAG: hypothetical protein AMXMBFR82_48830 [Candidatus Hydrogenedentota bacterium]
MNQLVKLGCLVLAFALLPASGFAEEEVCEGDAKPKDEWRGDKPDEWKDQEIREMVTTVMMVRMSRELELTDEQTVLMVRNFGDLRDTLSELGEQRGNLIDTLRDKVGNDAPDAEIEPILDQLMALDEKRDTVREEAFEKASADLTVAQRAKLYIFVQDFEWHMRRLIQKAREVGGDRVKRWHDEVVNGEDRRPNDSHHDDQQDDHEKAQDKPGENPPKQ